MSLSGRPYHASSDPVLPFSADRLSLVNNFVRLADRAVHFSNFLRMFTVENASGVLLVPPDSGTTAKRTTLWVPEGFASMGRPPDATARCSAMVVPAEDLQSIAAILAAGYLRYRRRVRREDLLDTAATPSPYEQEVKTSEKGEPSGDSSSRAD